ncbi:MAG: hypothetical protein M1544_00535 [Candidatus Marsarchaeota archaeon]|nr:hypothetical protein [Candidatus Marsarchaeota archaeon]
MTNKLELERVDTWIQKAKSESDVFDKYISYYIAYNMLYSLYYKKQNCNLDLGDKKDRYRAVNVFKFMPTKAKQELVCSIYKLLIEYVNKIPIETDEFWENKDKEGIASCLRQALLYKDNNKVLEYLAKWLYKVRCNIFHGSKDYSDKWAEMLALSNEIIYKILINLEHNYLSCFL